ncbi:MAG: hypothetical protein H7318_07420 [Oligoflexus sp.]|nr:hypothetical protein [Oligoflexus sp.]
MKMIPWTWRCWANAKVLILASTMTFGVACSDSNGSSSTPAPTTTGTGTGTGTGAGTDTAGNGTAVTGSGTGTDTGTGTAPSISCEDSWTAYVRARPVGFLLAYNITRQTKMADGTIVPSANSSYEDLVTASDDTHVLSKHTVTVQGLAKPIITNVDIAKEKWISTCNQGSDSLAGLPTAPADTTVEILENGVQAITVAAGSFTANHVKGKTSATNSESVTVFESWTLQDGSGILVRAVTQTNSDLVGASTTSDVTIELSKLVRP